MGYLPHALLNSLARLGWSYGDQEKFTKEELIEKFSIANLGKSAGVFNQEKLLDLNGWYMRQAPDNVLARELMPFLQKTGLNSLDENKVEHAVSTLKNRSKTLVDMAEGAGFYFQDKISFEKKSDDKFLNKDSLELLTRLDERMNEMTEFSHDHLEAVFVSFLEDEGIKLKKIAQPLRVALTGKTVSPGIFELMEVLGRAKVLERLGRAIRHIQAKA